MITIDLINKFISRTFLRYLCKVYYYSSNIKKRLGLYDFIKYNDEFNMQSLENWLNQYSEYHKNSMNIYIHKICIPFIVWSLLGMLWVSRSFIDSINNAYIAVILVSIFYWRLSKSYLIAMSLYFGIMIALLWYFDTHSNVNIFDWSLTIFLLSWLGQFVGHMIEGKKPSFFQDLTFLLIAPLWTIKPLLNSLKIKP